MIVAVAHSEFRVIGLDNLRKHFSDEFNRSNVIIDVKGIYGVYDLERAGLSWWRL